MVRALVLIAALSLSASCGAPAPSAPVDSFEARVRPLLVAHCYSCHSSQSEKLKGDLRLDRLAVDFETEAGRKPWQDVVNRVASGEMPPKGKPKLSEEEARALTDGIRGRATAVLTARRAAQGRVVLRRLNRAEYENTVRDLLDIDVDLQETLPPDTSSHGFDNLGEALHTSSFLLERYLAAADRVLQVAVSNGKQPPLVKKRLSFKDERVVKTATEKVYRTTDEGVVLFSSSHWNSIVVGQFYPPDRGRYRFRICASGVQSAGKPVVYRIDAGPMLMGTTNHFVDYFDAAPDQETVAEFVDRLEARSSIRLEPYGLATAQTVDKIGAATYTGPGLQIHWVEVEGPLHDQWPPASHRRLFGDLAQGPVSGGKLEVLSKDPPGDATRILGTFARRAFRRPVPEEEIRPYLDLVASTMASGRSFEQSVRVGLQAILVSPEFLFLRETPGPLDDFALASRLSYFLWSSMPDEELLGLAEQGRLREPGTLRGQVDRLLSSPRASAFTKNFVGQWLGLRDIDFTEPTHILYPDYDEMLKLSMVRETELYFAELLKEDLSVARFVASDFSILNGRLARLYGIPDVDGWRFRKVALPEGSHRGGVLTMASVLKVTANGTTTSPVLRGAWVLDRILGTPPPRPPADVPAVEPDIRGATTIREQLAKHRSVPTCAACHAKIDPPGFALENFDVIGGWREHYRTTGRGKEVKIDGRRMPYLQGPAVDAGDVTPDGRKFKDIDEFKRILLADLDKVARALAVKILTYATGGVPEELDQAEIDAIVSSVRGKGYGLRTLVHELVASRMFRSK